jgi:glycosyltransferase involved in cell wall biosynthesis
LKESLLCTKGEIMVSFIIPYRSNRENHIKNLEANISKYYSDYEIIIAEQDDNEPFKRGQLLNLGFKKSSSDIVVFMDVDIRFVDFLDYEKIMNENGRPFLPWDHRQQIVENGVNDFLILEDECYYCTQGFGGMTVFTRRQFEKSCGFSNLYIGWGGEDTIINLRSGSINRIPGKLYHIKHPSYMKEFDPTKDKYTVHNRKMISVHKKYVPKNDSFIHTKAKEEIVKEADTFKHYKFTEFNVADDCPYKDFIRKIYRSEVQ